MFFCLPIQIIIIIVFNDMSKINEPVVRFQNVISTVGFSVLTTGFNFTSLSIRGSGRHAGRTFILENVLGCLRRAKGVADDSEFKVHQPRLTGLRIFRFLSDTLHVWAWDHSDLIYRQIVRTICTLH